MDSLVKKEIIEPGELSHTNHLSNGSNLVSVIELSSSNDGDTGFDDDHDDTAFSADRKRLRIGVSDDGEENSIKKQRFDGCGVILPQGFLDPLPLVEEELELPEPVAESRSVVRIQSCKQFWKAGDYEGDTAQGGSTSVSAGLDHVRVHPKFLHSNATSHKWALGAFAELLDNSLDEVCNGATYVNIDMLENKKDGSKMLLVEDNGGGMNPDKMRQCMSLGYSAKSKLANTIGQYGNGFKTSTMRLGADVIVFSRCRSQHGRRPTQSIGMLSYTFLRNTGKEDIVVPMIDYEKGEKAWDRLVRSSSIDWNRNLETIVQWSPYSSEKDLLLQFNLIKDQGTHIIIYNLWEDDQGEMELDFGADRHDIQIRGVNRDEKKIQMAKQFPNSRHYLTYQHSLRSYASILYLRLPPGFRMILRGKDIEHHNLVNDMMLKQEVTYKPQPGAGGVPKDQHMVAVVTIGFVKDAKDHIDIQGFNVYHKNRLIKPFWRVWNAAGSDGRGAIGVLEANFVEPAHDKQGFERTTVLSRLEARLIQMQKTYWCSNCHKIGYASRHHKKLVDDTPPKETTPKVRSHPSSRHSMKVAFPSSVPHTNKCYSQSNHNQDGRRIQTRSVEKNEKERSHTKSKLPLQKSFQKDSFCTLNTSPSLDDSEIEQHHAPREGTNQVATSTRSEAADDTCSGNGSEFSLKKSKEQHHELKHRLKKMEESLQFERERCKLLKAQLLEREKKLEEANKEQEALIDIFQEERSRRDDMEESLRKKLKDANATIRELQETPSFNMADIKQERETMSQFIQGILGSGSA